MCMCTFVHIVPLCDSGEFVKSTIYLTKSIERTAKVEQSFQAISVV